MFDRFRRSKPAPAGKKPSASTAPAADPARPSFFDTTAATISSTSSPGPCPSSGGSSSVSDSGSSSSSGCDSSF